MEQTYIMIKPDGVQRGLVADIIKRFEQKGFTLRGLKMINVTKEHAENHYADLSSKCAPGLTASRRQRPCQLRTSLALLPSSYHHRRMRMSAGSRLCPNRPS
jgi:Nucleoside diphosphate kinase